VRLAAATSSDQAISLNLLRHSNYDKSRLSKRGLAAVTLHVETLIIRLYSREWEHHAEASQGRFLFPPMGPFCFSRWEKVPRSGGGNQLPVRKVRNGAHLRKTTRCNKASAIKKRPSHRQAPTILSILSYIEIWGDRAQSLWHPKREAARAPPEREDGARRQLPDAWKSTRRICGLCAACGPDGLARV
jgi:hypothetical protein